MFAISFLLVTDEFVIDIEYVPAPILFESNLPTRIPHDCSSLEKLKDESLQEKQRIEKIKEEEKEEEERKKKYG